MSQPAPRLIDLIHAAALADILGKWLEFYPEDAEGMRTALDLILTLKPDLQTEYVIQAKVFVCEGETFHEISCVLPTARDIKCLSLPWEVWLGARVPASVRSKYPLPDFLAHAMRGLTRLGYSPDHIARTLARMDSEFCAQREDFEAQRRGD